MEETGQVNQPNPQPSAPMPQQQQTPPAVTTPPVPQVPKRSPSPVMLIAIFFLLIILAVVVYIAMQRRSVAPSAPAEQVVAPEDVVQPDADAMPEESQSDEVADIQKDLDATAVNEEDTGYTEVNTDLNSL